MKSYRKEILDYAVSQYKTVPEYPWESSPDAAVLRHADNKKWYGLIMDVPKNKLGLHSNEHADILNVKCDPVFSGSLRTQEGFFPAYHMNKEKWISILLDGTVDISQILPLLDASFEMTGKKSSKTKSGQMRITKWIVPANPKYYDIETAVKEDGNGTFTWKQSSNIMPGDTVYLYVTAPVSAIMFKCKAVEVDIPYKYEDKNIRIQRAMRLKLLKRYDKNPVGIEKLKEHGVYAVRGPRSMPNSLVCEIEAMHK